MDSRTTARLARLAATAALLVGGNAQAGEVIVDLRSPGDYRSVTLAAPILDVDLVDAFNGACRMNRTWGFDPHARTVWVNGGDTTVQTMSVVVTTLDSSFVHVTTAHEEVCQTV